MNRINIRVNNRTLVLEVLPRQSVGAEIGVAKGDYSARLIKGVKPKRLFLIDPWIVFDEGPQRRAAHYGSRKVDQKFLDSRYEYVCKRFRREREAGQVDVFRGVFEEWMEANPEQRLDWVYVDGDHTYEGVLKDLRNARKLVKDEGLIACDDYGTGGWWQGGVTRAVHQFLTEENFVVEFALGTQIVLRKTQE